MSGLLVGEPRVLALHESELVELALGKRVDGVVVFGSDLFGSCSVLKEVGRDEVVFHEFGFEAPLELGQERRAFLRFLEVEVVGNVQIGLGT